MVSRTFDAGIDPLRRVAYPDVKRILMSGRTRRAFVGELPSARRLNFLSEAFAYWLDISLTRLRAGSLGHAQAIHTYCSHLRALILFGSHGRVYRNHGDRRRVTTLNRVNKSSEPSAQRPEFIFGQLLDIDQRIVSAFLCRNQFVDLELKCEGVLVLRSLYKKHHQKCHQIRDRVNEQLPGVRVVEQWTD